MISIIFISIAGILNAFMDLSSENRFHNNKYNKTKGDNNDEDKWKQPLVLNNKRHWYYLGLMKPKYIERFPFSSTGLVFLTDWWHRFKSLMLICIFVSIVLYTPITKHIIVDFIILHLTFSCSFELVYKRLKNYLS